MSTVKKISVLISWAVIAIGVIGSLGFVNKTQESSIYTNIDIKVNHDNGLFFLDKKSVLEIISRRGDSIINNTKHKVNIPELEHILNSHENIETSEVYATIDGTVKVDVKQRKPVLRIINSSNESFYVDDKGVVMPLSQSFTANVIIANGAINDPYIKHHKQTLANSANKENVRTQTTIMNQLYDMAMFIDSSKFWKSQIKQIFINGNLEIELIPLVGSHTIIFGSTENMRKKFSKLITFYREGINTTNSWDKYSTINLKYKNQIVCTKK